MQAVKKRTDRLTVPVTVEWEGKANRKHVLQRLIEKNNFTTMAEVGVRDGRTTFYLLDNIPGLKIFAIDTNISGFYNDEKKQKYKDRLVPMQGLSEHMADLIPNGSLDLVFIDANHSYEYVKKDIIKYTPKLKSTGLLTGHDIDYPGVNKAVKEMIPVYEVAPNFVWIKKNESSTI
jgi:predicted O-methyltransferase YrrM